MFQIKICGVTTSEDAQVVARAGADALGLNFYPASKRYVTPANAATIVQQVPAGIARVGVFVNATADEIFACVRTVSLDLIQLHGDETLEFVEQLPPLPWIKAIRCDDDGSAAIEFLEQCKAANRLPEAVLLDAYEPGTYGGTGKQLDWPQMALLGERLGVPLILAGGLRWENVAEAIAVARPAAVDVASGVEEQPARKSQRLVEAFVNAARDAFSRRRMPERD